MAALACGMADHFNNILTTVMGACSLIDRDDPANAELLRYVALIRASAERAVTLSDRLMHVGTQDQEAGHSEGLHQYPASATILVRDNKVIGGIVPTNNSGGVAS
jgi:nitrogen-specific signal transduction histidine kinase